MKQLYRKHKQLIPLIILSLLSVRILIALVSGKVELAGIRYEFSLSNKHYFTFIALTICFLSYSFFRKAYRYILILTILPGLFNTINFAALETSTRYSLGSFGITVQTSCLIVALLTLAINLDKVGDLLSVSEKNNTK